MYIKKFGNNSYLYENGNYIRKATPADAELLALLENGENAMKELTTNGNTRLFTQLLHQLRDGLLDYVEKFLPLEKKIQITKNIQKQKEEVQTEKAREFFQPEKIKMQDVLAGKITWQNIRHREAFEKGERIRKFLKV